MSHAQSQPAFTIRGWHVLAAFVLFFGVTLAVDTLMIVRAYSTYPGEVATTPYEDGLAYDGTLDQQRIQANLGWRMTIGLVRPGVVRLTAIDKAGTPISGLRIEANLSRPATEQGKRSIVFSAVSKGAYETDIGPISGAWDVKLSAFDARNRRFDAERRIVAP